MPTKRQIELQEAQERFLDKYAQKLALNMFRVGCTPTNYKIINMLPATTGEVQKAIGLTHMPTHKRIRELTQAGLISRKEYRGKLEVTKMGKGFLEVIKTMQNEVIKE